MRFRGYHTQSSWQGVTPSVKDHNTALQHRKHGYCPLLGVWYFKLAKENITKVLSESSRLLVPSIYLTLWLQYNPLGEHMHSMHAM